MRQPDWEGRGGARLVTLVQSPPPAFFLHGSSILYLVVASINTIIWPSLVRQRAISFSVKGSIGKLALLQMLIRSRDTLSSATWEFSFSRLERISSCEHLPQNSLLQKPASLLSHITNYIVHIMVRGIAGCYFAKHDIYHTEFRIVR